MKRQEQEMLPCIVMTGCLVNWRDSRDPADSEDATLSYVLLLLQANIATPSQIHGVFLDTLSRTLPFRSSRDTINTNALETCCHAERLRHIGMPTNSFIPSHGTCRSSCIFQEQLVE